MFTDSSASPGQPVAGDALPAGIYSVAQVRAFDRTAIERYAIPGYRLMCRAGAAALAVVRRRWPRVRRLSVYCGAGNNAGDGYVLARLGLAQGFDVRVSAIVDPQRLRGDARQAWQDAVAAGVRISTMDEGTDKQFEPQLIVDALLGTGADRALDGDFSVAVDAINSSGFPVIALDFPSGLHADRGAVLGSAVRADMTITFVGLKQGTYLGDAPDHCGEVVYSDLGIPDAVFASAIPVLTRLQPVALRPLLPRRRRGAHKGDHGRVLLVGGSPDMPGAIRLAAEAALRAGAGLVHVATHPGSRGAVTATRPELICHGVDTPEQLAPLRERADAIVVGPGLGTDEWARSLLVSVLAARCPVVIDADALNLLASAEPVPGPRNWILTPHPGEAGRLLGRSTGDVQQDRLGAVLALRERHAATVVLKGACTLVAGVDSSGRTEPVAVCDRGNPGMASGGTGDVLAGLLGALLAQSGEPGASARAGVLIHALAGDEAAAHGGERGMIASDLMQSIRRWVNPS